MATDYGFPTGNGSPSPSFSNAAAGSADPGNFECNICFDLAQDPIVTLCGHLFCWPCLYKWLHIHSRCQECPVCKALIEEEKLVPLYGRGTNPADPRSKSMPGIEIPHRPAGQRPETAPRPNPNVNNPFAHQGFGFTGGFGPFAGGFAAPAANAWFGNLTLSAALGGLFHSFFNVQLHGFQNPNLYGPGHGFSDAFHGGQARAPDNHGNHHQASADSTLKVIFMVLGLSVLVTLLWS